MSLNKLKLCGNKTEFTGIQGFLRNEDHELKLNLIGDKSNKSDFDTCDEFEIPQGDYIDKILMSYSSRGINRFKATTEGGKVFTMGKAKANDKESVTKFTKDRQIVGFFGYKIESITALGFYRYMCGASTPEETDITEYDCELKGLEYDFINGGCLDRDADEDCFDGKDPCDVKPDDQLDPDNPGRDTDEEIDETIEIIEVEEDEEIDETIEIIEVEEDNSADITSILVVLICALFFLATILCFTAYLLRSNENSVSVAMVGRRHSAANLKENYYRKASAIYDEDKMENQGEDINIMHADDEQIAQQPVSETAVIAMFTQVPSDDEIKELFKGKTTWEKRLLLKEIEKARQQKIHLEYLLEQ